MHRTISEHLYNGMHMARDSSSEMRSDIDSDPVEYKLSSQYKDTIFYSTVPEPNWATPSSKYDTFKWEEVRKTSFEYRRLELYFKITEYSKWNETWKQVWKLVRIDPKSVASLLSTSNSTSSTSTSSNSTSSTSTSASTSSTSSSDSSISSNVPRECVAIRALRVLAAAVAESAALCLMLFTYEAWSERTAHMATAPHIDDFFVAAWLSFDVMAIDNAAVRQIQAWRIWRRWCRVCTCICPTWRPYFVCRSRYFGLCYLFSLCT